MGNAEQRSPLIRASGHQGAVFAATEFHYVTIGCAASFEDIHHGENVGHRQATPLRFACQPIAAGTLGVHPASALVVDAAELLS